jgi:hypothetical protein
MLRPTLRLKALVVLMLISAGIWWLILLTKG